MKILGSQLILNSQSNKVHETKGSSSTKQVYSNGSSIKNSFQFFTKYESSASYTVNGYIPESKKQVENQEIGNRDHIDNTERIQEKPKSNVENLMELKQKEFDKLRIHTYDGTKVLSQEEIVAMIFKKLFEKIAKMKNKRMKSIEDVTNKIDITIEELTKLKERLAQGKPLTGEESLQLISAVEGEGKDLTQYVYVEENVEVSVKESQSTSFSAQGIIKTADGREMNIEIMLNMSRESQYTSKTFQSYFAEVKDPLVINLGGNTPTLTKNKFSFDIDCDGKKDNISFLEEGSGFLALDKNNDGIINDGSELFGTKSGNGFADLAQYDLDENGWIDENDKVFEDLKIWSKDDNGKDQLVAITQVGIGAIYLGNVPTEYAIKSIDGMIDGIIRKTGIFLKENGEIGTIQQLDLAV